MKKTLKTIIKKKFKVDDEKLDRIIRKKLNPEEDLIPELEYPKNLRR